MKYYRMGLDIGSTTVKLVVLNEENYLIYSEYKRHLSDIKNTLIDIIKNCYENIGDIPLLINITGSGGLSVSRWLNINFIQEVVACATAVEKMIPKTDVVIELGGEDAKITYFKGGMEQRMNASCAGGTGAFIDQMAVLLDTDTEGLNEYAKGYQMIYPIASRCGVFAKTDVQPLMNDGARKEDIAASILQAVANQTIGGLACGKPIRGKVAFLGGPLYFLSELRKRFIESLDLSEENAIIPKHSQLFVAMGAALSKEDASNISLKDLLNKVDYIKDFKEEEVGRLEPLFLNQEEYQAFVNKHNKAIVRKDDISTYQGRTYLGIDAGSTTTKVALIGEDDQLLYSYYGSNKGHPLNKIISIIKDLYQQLPPGATIAKCTVTGYGEALIKAALHADIGEIETVAHYKAAQHFLPGVDFILDIGGQDMKCLRIKNGTIDSILLNEACSSGCGSFLEGFAASLNMTAEEFASIALFSKAPVNLGTKCTVFMNSKVKQAQKEGADLSDLSAGLSYSVIKNALYKVIKIRDEGDMGSKIIVQGGTFHNDAVLRCFELVSGREAVRPDIAGLMGAYGAALIAKERYTEGEKTTLLPKELLSDFNTKSSNRRCKQCQNNCLLTISSFSNGESFTAGNRCERGLEQKQNTMREQLPNLYQYKYKRTFQYTPLVQEEAKRGLIGIPRVLNMYENYPFWFTLLSELGFSVIISSPSGKKHYEKGLETIPSEAVCYPAKLCHGHVLSLLEKGVKTIFYPSIVFEKTEYSDATNHYNCPVVISYPEIIKSNIDELKENNVKLIFPFFSLDNEKVLVKRILEEFKDFHVTSQEAKRAVIAACKERERYKNDIRKKGEEALNYLKENNKKGIVLCGKPYHVDPEVNHGISDLIISYGMAVLTEDSISHMANLKHKLRVIDQWVYNSRLYRAATLVAQEPNLELVQLNSFGCGLDAITSDQIAELLATGGKMYTTIKIDEGNNLGAAKIRIRSLKAAMEERERITEKIMENRLHQTPIFTKEMRKSHTILVPQMAPFHLDLLQEAARASGYQFEVLPAIDFSATEVGLRYVNNDACYPAIIVIGQIIQALKSGKYDIHHTSVIITQTGGSCRATNYIAFIKLGLKQAGFGHVPVISLNASGLGEQPGFTMNLGMINRCIMSMIYGDLFMKVLYRTRPYEKIAGSAQALYEYWNHNAKLNIRNGDRSNFKKTIMNVINAFEHLELMDVKKPKVAIVGEIFLKYHPTANNDIVGILEDCGAEVSVPGLTDFLLYCTFNSKFKYKYLAGEILSKKVNEIAASYIMKYRRVVEKALDQSKRFTPLAQIEDLADMVSPIISLGNQSGEGWMVPAEMIEYIKQGTNNIICVQPLACLPNHVIGKGMIKPVKDRYQEANIMPIDFDPGISSVNQLNRIKLMLSVAMKNLENELKK